jgi:hypothetical protein
MASVIVLRPKCGRRFKILVEGQISEELVDDVRQDEIARRQWCIERAKKKIWHALEQVMIENELIDRWRAQIAELEAARDQSVVIDFPTPRREENADVLRNVD